MASSTVNFSNTSLTAISPPTTGRDVYRDTKTPGLELRVTSAGAKTFSVFKRTKDGHPERVTLGRFPAVSVEQARKMAGKVFTAIAEGVSPAAIKRAHKEELTFGQLFAQYMERHAKSKKTTFMEDQQRYTQYLEQPLGSKKLSAIDLNTVRAVHTKITNDGRPTVANRVLAVISTTFGRGIEWGYLTHNPATGVRRNKEESRERFLQPDELKAFFDSLAKEPNETIRDFLFIGLFTGARKANVLAMKWSDLNFERQIWRISQTKNGTPQDVILVDSAIERLKARRNAPDSDPVYVFPGDGKTGHLAAPAKGWRRVLENAGIADLRIHDLRRTLASWQAMTGASLPIIGKSLNHKTPQATAIYARLNNDPVRASMQKAATALKAAGIEEFVKVEPHQPTQSITTDNLTLANSRRAKE
ncbi:MAG: site-specific integrase [Actinomycetota bacterium]|nr:site-specific integrase [Actinomycetota bacterium]